MTGGYHMTYNNIPILVHAHFGYLIQLWTTVHVYVNFEVFGLGNKIQFNDHKFA